MSSLVSKSTWVLG